MSRTEIIVRDRKSALKKLVKTANKKLICTSLRLANPKKHTKNLWLSVVRKDRTTKEDDFYESTK